MNEFREAYIEAREQIAEDLIRKYNFIESYADDNRLSLENSKYSIHLTFRIPDGENVNISKRNDHPSHSNSFMHYLVQVYPDLQDMKKALKSMFGEVVKNDYSSESIAKKLHIKLRFLEEKFPAFFLPKM